MFKQVFCVLCYFDDITAHKFVKIHTDTSNVVYYIFLSLYIQYEDSTILTLPKTSSTHIKNYGLNKLAAFYVIWAAELRINLCNFI
jgi:hypothetical protein